MPIDATSVTAYIVVAADLQDNPVQTFALTELDEQCGVVSSSGEVVTDAESLLIGAQLIASEIVISRSFCGWLNPVPSTDVQILGAWVRLYNGRPDLSGEPFGEYLPFGPTLDASDYGLATIADPHAMMVSEAWRRRMRETPSTHSMGLIIPSSGRSSR